MATSNNEGSKKPNDSAFRQQKLPAWQPILTAGTVLPTFFVIGLAFLPIGIGMFHISNSVMEKVIDYTDCKNSAGQYCYEVIANDTAADCQCEMPFVLDQTWEKPVYMYYGLTNFYQNHRRYVKSRDDKQLLGDIERTPSSDCSPYDKSDGKAVVPCGAIANSLFSDRLALKYKSPDAELSTSSIVNVPVIRTGIAWDSDKAYKFKNPPIPAGKTLKDVLANTSKPEAWRQNLWELDEKNPENNGLQNEDLIIWMRTAALPNFRKLYRRINHTVDWLEGGLPSGNYTFVIDYRFRVKQFSGTKSVVLSQTSILGAKNPFLGIAYMVVGTICLVIGVVFLFIHIKYGRATGDMLNMGSSRPSFT